MIALEARNVSLGYDARLIVKNLSIEIPEGSFTTIVGPNGCGKSTFLKGLAGLLKPQAGDILLHNARVTALRNGRRAALLSYLPQSPIAPDGLSVEDLVARGRNPYRKLFRRWTAEDRQAVKDAMAYTGVDIFSETAMSDLSGGQRQRVWLALILAQQTGVVLLDEPTTYLDISHQIHVLDICKRLHRNEGRTIVAVLHDLNLAIRYSTHMIMMKNGELLAKGPPRAVVTPDLMREAFGIECAILDVSGDGELHMIPKSRIDNHA